MNIVRRANIWLMAVTLAGMTTTVAWARNEGAPNQGATRTESQTDKDRQAAGQVREDLNTNREDEQGIRIIHEDALPSRWEEYSRNPELRADLVGQSEPVREITVRPGDFDERNRSGEFSHKMKFNRQADVGKTVIEEKSIEADQASGEQGDRSDQNPERGQTGMQSRREMHQGNAADGREDVSPNREGNQEIQGGKATEDHETRKSDRLGTGATQSGAKGETISPETTGGNTGAETGTTAPDASSSSGRAGEDGGGR